MIEKYDYYLSGPMTGIEDYNFPAFHGVAKFLRGCGYDVFNPAESFEGNTELPWTTYMKHDFKNIQKSSKVMLLPGWRSALGAVLEVIVGLSTDHEIWEFNNFESKRIFDEGDIREIVNNLMNTYVKGINSKDDDSQSIDCDPQSILQEAQGLVHGDRGNSYGHPYLDFKRSSMIATAILLDKLKPGMSVEPEDIPLIMQGVKISREVNKPQRDNRTDGAGYWETLDMVWDYKKEYNV